MRPCLALVLWPLKASVSLRPAPPAPHTHITAHIRQRISSKRTGGPCRANFRPHETRSRSLGVVLFFSRPGRVRRRRASSLCQPFVLLAVQRCFGLRASRLGQGSPLASLGRLVTTNAAEHAVTWASEVVNNQISPCCIAGRRRRWKGNGRLPGVTPGCPPTVAPHRPSRNGKWRTSGRRILAADPTLGAVSCLQAIPPQVCTRAAAFLPRRNHVHLC